MQNDIAASLLPKLRLSHWRDVLFGPEAGAGSQSATDSSERILIIEDDLLIASQIEATLAEAGFEIAGVTGSGEEALELAKDRRPTLAVIDIRLAGDRQWCILCP